MMRRHVRSCLAPLAMAVLAAFTAAGAGLSSPAEPVRSHPPMRPLPTPSDRPMGAGPARFVDPVRGDDAADGSLKTPWKSLQRAVSRLQPGDTLLLRGGIYYEHLFLTRSGASNAPITIRAYPGELAIVDGGLREFFEKPADCWKPLPGGADGEFVSTRAYPGLDTRAVPAHFVNIASEPFTGIENERPLVLGQFGDSMVPLHGYRTLADLRSTNEFWKSDKQGMREEGLYCGPGLWYDRETGLIHIRLAPTRLEGLGSNAYRGEADPRKLPLVIAGGFGNDVLRLTGIRHVRLQDLVFRGGTGSALINVYGSEDLEFDGITVYGGAPALLFNACANVRLVHSAIRSLAAPWSSRSSMKYRGTPSYAIITQQTQPENHDFEFAFNEFTDGHDFAWLRFVSRFQFHHNLVDNFNDDGVEVGARKRNHAIFVYQNLLKRINMTFVLCEIEKDESPADVDPGSGIYLFRNLIDLRGGVYSSPPNAADPAGTFLHADARLCNDHGSPVWPLYHFYQNTVIDPKAPWRDLYGSGLGARGPAGSPRWLFNNIFLTLAGLPGRTLVQTPGFQIDGNLHWSAKDGPGLAGDFFESFRKSKLYEDSKRDYAPGWTTHDRFADPQFVSLGEGLPTDVRLKPGSPALDAGVPVPPEWPDPLRAADAGKPDIGALPAGVDAWPLGIHNRLDLDGNTR